MSDVFNRGEVETTLCTALSGALAEVGRHALTIERYANELPDWEGWPNHCHAQVAWWLQWHAGDVAVRGWLLDGSGGDQVHLVAHSLVRTVAGEVVDVAFDVSPHEQTFFEHPPAAGDFEMLLKSPSPLTEVWVPAPPGFAKMFEPPEHDDSFFQPPIGDHTHPI